MDPSLVHGYIRRIEKLLDKKQIIPMDIFHICFDYYFTTKIIFYLAALRSALFSNGTNNSSKAKVARDSIICAADIDSKSVSKN